MYLPKCHNKEKDCFANELDDRCNCLKSTKFPLNICPFYKPSDKVDVEGMDDAVRLYAMKHGGPNDTAR